jgi:hypothetical protein
MYDGDSIIRPAPKVREETLDSGDSTPKMVRRKITPVAPMGASTEPYLAEPFVIDTFGIERRARALRAAAVRSALVSFWSWVERLFETSRRRRVEGYLARAQSIAELEARLRKLERGGHLARI